MVWLSVPPGMLNRKHFSPVARGTDRAAPNNLIPENVPTIIMLQCSAVHTLLFCSIVSLPLEASDVLS